MREVIVTIDYGEERQYYKVRANDHAGALRAALTAETHKAFHHKPNLPVITAPYKGAGFPEQLCPESGAIQC